MEFCDLKTQYKRYHEEINTAIQKVLVSGRFVFGPEVGEFECSLAEFLGVKYVVACANGTDALYLALKAAGIGPGDEVITSPFTFFATGEMIAELGAKPIWCDIDEKDFNLNPNLVEGLITEKTKAIVPVSLFGLPYEYAAIKEIAAKHNIKVIEDAAQSLGASFNEADKELKSGALGGLATTSFFPAKPLGCYGDGGAVMTNDESLYYDLIARRNHGQKERYKHDFIGINSRLDTIQAAVLGVKLKYYSQEIKLRQERAAYYTHRLKNLVQCPDVFEHKSSVWAQYTIRTSRRDELVAYLQEKKIPVAVHYPIPLHKQKAFASDNDLSFPNSEKAANEVLSLPMSADLSVEDQDTIIEAIKTFFS